MAWLKRISIRHNILLVASMGLLAFLVYFSYSSHLLRANIRQFDRIEKADVPLLQHINRSKLEFLRARESFQLAINNSDADELEQGKQLSIQFRTALHELGIAHPELVPQTERLLKAYRRYETEVVQLAHGAVGNTMTPAVFYAGISRTKALEEKFLQQQEQFEQQLYAAFQKRLADSRQNNDGAHGIGLVLGVAAMLALGLISWVARNVNKSLVDAARVADAITEGHWDVVIDTSARQQSGHLMQAIATMRDTIRSRMEEDRRLERRKTQLAGLHERMRGDLPLPALCQNVLSYLAQVLDIHMGAFYVRNPRSGKLTLISGYALTKQKGRNTEFALGESLVGQAALTREQIIMNQVPENYAEISSGMGAILPRHIMVIPVLHEDEAWGVLELGSLYDYDTEASAFLNECLRSIAIALVAAESRAQLSRALEYSRNRVMENDVG